ncbi:MAG TPA: diacylglycerol kinase [Gallionella sp.]|nr:diacylglycerol kinase [Gallionella sp.]
MSNPNKHPRGLLHAWHSSLTALAGLREAWQHEDAFRQELFVALIAIPVALFLPVSNIGKALLVGSILLVLVVELLNSAIEAAVDFASLERHPLAKRAKDVASAAVLLSIVNALAVWGLVLFA